MGKPTGERKHRRGGKGSGASAESGAKSGAGRQQRNLAWSPYSTCTSCSRGWVYNFELQQKPRCTGCGAIILKIAGKHKWWEGGAAADAKSPTSPPKAPEPETVEAYKKLVEGGSVEAAALLAQNWPQLLDADQSAPMEVDAAALSPKEAEKEANAKQLKLTDARKEEERLVGVLDNARKMVKEARQKLGHARLEQEKAMEEYQAAAEKLLASQGRTFAGAPAAAQGNNEAPPDLQVFQAEVASISRECPELSAISTQASEQVTKLFADMRQVVAALRKQVSDAKAAKTPPQPERERDGGGTQSQQLVGSTGNGGDQNQQNIEKKNLYELSDDEEEDKTTEDTILQCKREALAQVERDEREQRDRSRSRERRQEEERAKVSGTGGASKAAPERG